ncbi:MAG: aminoacyl-tRNA hydrolase [Calditrichales bacterium]|nr:MAG: aminoacyl-tRNA hydrolase [Calditrichales bacterium]
MKKFIKKIIPLKLKYFIAILHRRRINHVTFIGITGSAGKTTTKDLTASILSVFGHCQKTYLSCNTMDVIPATVWRTRKAHRYCVAELAAYGPGTLDKTVRMFKPDIAVITRIGRDHYAAYKSMEELAAEKGEIVSGLSTQGIAVLNIDDPMIRAIGERCNRRIIWFGKDDGATLRLIEAHSLWPDTLTLLLEYQDKIHKARTQLHGTHMAIPVLASLGVALAADLSLEKAIGALELFQPIEGRMQLTTSDDGVTFIRDDWKAPYWSINEPLEFLKDARAKRKIVIIGMICDVSGDYGPKYKNIAGLCREFADLVVFIGPHALRALRGSQNKKDASIRGFLNIQNAAGFLRNELRPCDLVLVKGTNEQDHLVRLIIDRDKPIHCWTDQCFSQLYCDKCSKLYESSKDTSFVAPVSPQNGPGVPVVVGLGNPGSRFYRTPHNVGYRVLDKIAESEGGNWIKNPEGWVCDLKLQGEAVQLFKPGVAINNSGIMVQRFLARMGSSLQNCIIIHEDIKLSFGNVRLKSNGGDAGHKGMRSILSVFDTENISRVRLGVAGLDNTREAKWFDFEMRKDVRKPKQFVLTKFSREEEERLIPVIEQAAEIVRKCIQKH